MATYSSQIIKTLSDQIQHLLPLRHHQEQLQHYHQQLQHDYHQLASFGKISEADAESKLKYLEQVKRQLDQESFQCAEYAKTLQCQYAKSVMEANQKAALCQSLQKKWEIEVTQEQTLLKKRNDLAEATHSLEFNISKFKELIHSLQMSIKSKEFENLEMERQIKKMELVNSKISQFNKEAECSIQKVETQNMRMIEDISTVESKIETYDKLILTKQRMNRQSMEMLISKTKELKQLNHKKQYVSKLAEAQENDVMALSRNCYELESFLKLKKEKVMCLKQENRQYEGAIDEQSRRRQESKKQLGELSYRLKTFIEINKTLYKELQRSCSQDRDVQIKLSQKLDKLIVTGQKITTNDILHQYDLNSLSKYQSWADVTTGRKKSSAIIHSKPTINQNESTGQQFYSAHHA